MFPSFRAPETMTATEQALLLTATSAHDEPRDHLHYSMALGTGLRFRRIDETGASLVTRTDLAGMLRRLPSGMRIAPLGTRQWLMRPALIHL